MKEAEIDISAGRSKSVGEFAGQRFDLVVSVCDHADKACPYFPGALDRQHWPFDDPADSTGTDSEKLPIFRRVRDQIRSTIDKYLATVSR